MAQEKPKSKNARDPQKPSSLIGSIKASPAKKFSAIIGFLGVIIGVIAGGTGLVKDFLSSREQNREIMMHLDVGDRFVEQYKLNEGIAEFEKALEIDKDNIEAHRRIISAMRIKYEVGNEPIPTVEEAQTKIYQLQALYPVLKDDPGLMVEEARILRYNNKPGNDQFNLALKIMADAQKQFPENPEVLAQLGLLRALSSPVREIEGIDLLKRQLKKLETSRVIAGTWGGLYNLRTSTTRLQPNTTMHSKK